MSYLPECFSVRRVATALSVVCAAFLMFSPLTVFAQARSAMIRETVDDASRVTLAGNTHPQVAHAEDMGRVPDETAMGEMMLVLKRSPVEEQSLEVFLQSLQDKNSPNFHHWLKAEQFGAQWGAVDSDLAAVKSWLESHGFTVAPISAGRTVVEFSGTAGQIREAFHTEIHTYKVNGEVHHANVSDPQIPAALAPMIAGVASLNDFAKHPALKRGPQGHFDAAVKKVRPTLTTLGGGDFLYVTPADAATIYDTPVGPLNPNYGGTLYAGAGVTIGIVGKSNIDPTQVAHYRKLFGLPAKAVQIIPVGSNPGETLDDAEWEAYLDLEVAGGLAAESSILYYVAGDTMLNDGIDLASVRAINDDRVDILSVSWGQCELFLGSSGNMLEFTLWRQASAQGITVVVATGDGGAADCDQNTPYSGALFGLTVNGLASTPYNVAVGGTQFSALAGPDGSGANFTNYVSLTNTPGTYGSALGYIPETPWNDSITNYPPLTLSKDRASPYFAGAGGGASGCTRSTTTNTTYTCLSGYGKPSWQAGPGVPADKSRDLPDVSLLADNGYYMATWGICTNLDYDSNFNPVSDCVPGSNGLPAGDFYVAGVGGTSAATPAFAGILALVAEFSQNRLGQANYVLYNLARQGLGFNDVTTGNIAQPCLKGTPNCEKNAAGQLFTTGWDAGAGYDLASGWGSVDAATLMYNWGAAGLNSSSTVLTISPTSVEHGNPVTVKVTVTGSPTATGNVAMVAEPGSGSAANGVAVGTYPLLSGGSTGNFTVNSLPGGSYDLMAIYGGSTTLSASPSNVVAVTVSPEPSTTPVQVFAYNPVTGNSVPLANAYYGLLYQAMTTPYGNNSPHPNGTVRPDGIATGTVTFNAAGQAFAPAALSISGQAASPTFLLPVGTSSVVAAYSGDRSFKPSTGSTAVKIGPAPTTLQLTTSAVSGTKPITYTVDLTSLSAGVAPSGTVSLWQLGKVIATGNLVGVSGAATGQATGKSVITTLAAHWGKHQVTATYGGDENYKPSTSNAVDVTGLPSFSLTGGSFSLTSDHSTYAYFLWLTSEGGYEGTAKLTCALTSAPSSDPAPALCGFEGDTVNVLVNGKAKTVFLVWGKGTKLPPGVTAGSLAPWIGGTAVLACCLLVGIPARRRAWRNLLAVVLLVGALFSLSACVAQPKLITPGKYTFTVTATDTKNSLITTTSKVVVTVP